MIDRVLRRCTPALLAILATGCFTYRPATLEDLEPGETVRAFLTREQVAELDGVLTAQNRRVTGTVVQTTPERLLVDVAVGITRDNTLARPLRQRIALPAATVLDLEKRTLNGFRTTLVVIGAAGVAAALVAWQIEQGDNSPGRDTRDPPDAARVPVIRISIPLSGGG